MALTDALIDDQKLTADARQIVDRVQAVVEAELKQAGIIISQDISAAVLQISNVASGILTGAQAIEDKTMHDVAELLEKLDGWTLTITLNKPKPK